MSKYWLKAPLGEMLRCSGETITLQPDSEYRELTVRLWGKGVILRRVVTGSELATTRRNVAHAGNFILSRIDARNGAFGLVPAELNGAVVTNDFPVFTLDETRLLPTFLEWITRTVGFVEKCKKASEGTTNRVRLRTDSFLAVEIPIPPVTEQKRVVAWITELATLVEEARTLRRQATIESDILLAARERQIWPDATSANAKSLESMTVFLARGRQSEQGQSDHFLIKTQHVQQDHYAPTAITMAPHAAAKVKPEAMVRDGDILIACSAAGCLGRVARYHGQSGIASTDTHVAIVRPNVDVVDPDYLYAYLRGAQGQFQLRSRERGDWQRAKIGFRLTELNVRDLRMIPVPLPSRVEQRRIVADLTSIGALVAKLKRLQSEAAAELDAMVPAILNQAFRGEL